jgi:hypothetical protein
MISTKWIEIFENTHKKTILKEMNDIDVLPIAIILIEKSNIVD